MSDSVNEMRSVRQGEGKAVKANIVSSNEGGSSPAPDFQDAGTFLRGGGKVDGEMDNIGSASSVAKGSKSPGPVSLEKGSRGPKGPGAI